MILTWILVAGAVAGLGLLALVLALDDGPAPGPAALARLDLDRRRFRRETVLSSDEREGESMSMRRTGARVRELLEARGLSVPATIRSDLSMVDQSIESFIATCLLGAVAGFFLPVLLVLVVSLTGGFGLSATPLWLGLFGALLGLLVPALSVRGRATERRRDFRHVVGSFLDLVAMNLSGGRGVPEALQGAASVSDGWAMVRIRTTLQTARLQGVTPWAALGQLGDDLQVDELRDLAAALALVAEDGAKVRDSLYARAESMRQRELADAEGRAQADSQSMLVAQLLLCVGFLVFLTYPAVSNIVGGL